MPIYEYVCDACGQESEFLVRGSEADDPRACPACGAAQLTKKMSVTAVPRYPAPRGGRTCCGREEKCDSPPCGGGACCMQ